MIKLVYLLWPRRRMSPLERRVILLEQCAPELLRVGLAGLQMNIADDRVDTPSPAPQLLGPRPFAAEVCLWLTDETLSLRAAHEDVLRAAGCIATTAKPLTQLHATGPTVSAVPVCSR